MPDVEELLGQMTLQEKVGQLNLPCVYVDQLGKSIDAKMDACRRFAAGTYTLGQRLRSLSAPIPADDLGYDLAAMALPHLKKLSSEIGESSKVSIFESGATVVLVGVQGKRDYALTFTEGQRLPIHAGAGSKVLLAHVDKADRETVLGGPLRAFTERTYARREALARELAKVTAKMVDTVLQGKEPEINDTKTYNNEVKVVPSFLLTPYAVGKGDIKKALVESGYYTQEQIDN